MVENIIVCVIVGGVLVLTGRAFYRTLAGKNDGCGCGSSCSGSATCQESPEDVAQERTLLQINVETQNKGGEV